MNERIEAREKRMQLSNSRPVGLLLILLFVGGLSSCSEEPTTASSTATDASRWYGDSQLAKGAEVFATNCALCHGDEAQGLTADWRQKLDDGSFPPPPLNGSAHAWHHPRSVLLQVINNGGAAFGGQMPAFANVLEDEEKLSAIAYFQSFWSDEIYEQWVDIGGNN